jgi:tetratricopeptide (TPR) repeat protein
VVYLACHLAYQLEDDSAKEMVCLEQCRRWGGSNEESELQILRQRVRQALEEEDPDEALEILESADPHNARKPEVVRLRAACHFRRGLRTAERAGKLGTEITSSTERFLDAWQGHHHENLKTVDELYGQSLQDMQQASELDPQQNVIQQASKQIEEALSESRYYIILRAAHKVLDEGHEQHYEVMIEPLKSVPAQIELANHARKFLCAIHFRLAVSAANAGSFSFGESHMLASVKLDPKNRVVKRQCAQLYVAWGLSFLTRAGEVYRPLEASANAFVEEANQQFRNTKPAAAKLLVEAEQKLRVALNVAPTEDRSEISEVMNHIRDPERFYWGALLGAAHNALEDERKVHFERLGDLLLKCPVGHAAKQGADGLAAAIFFRLGIEQAKKEHLEEARRSLETAAGLAPDNAAIREQLEILRQLLREQGPRKAFLIAKEAVEHEDYEAARRLAETIPADFSGYDNVQGLLALIYSKLGEAAFRAKNLAEAIRCAEQALTHLPGNPTLAENLQRLQAIRAQGGFKALEARNASIKAHNEGVEIANNVVKILKMTQETGNGITPDIAELLLAQLEQAANLTGGDPDIVQLRDQLRTAVRRY